MKVLRILAFATAFILLTPSWLCAADTSGPANLNEAVAAALAADSTICSLKSQLAVKSPADENGNPITPARLRQEYIADVNAKALSVAKDLIDLHYSTAKYNFLITQKAALASELAKAQANFKLGAETQADADAVQKKVDQNTYDINTYQMLMVNAKNVYKSLTKKDIPANFDFAGCYFIMDAANIPSPLPIVSLDSAVDSNQQLDDVIKDFRSLGDSINTYITDTKALQAAQNNFKTGAIDSASLSKVKDAADSAKIDALEKKADYSEDLYKLDSGLQGFLSKKIKKPRAGSIFINSADLS